MKNKIGGWVQLDADVVYENPWIKVTHENVRRPNQTEGIYGVVHFKSNAVGIVPIDEDGNTWLVRQSRYTLDCYTWEIPEGGSPIGESPLATAKRELQEEVGLEAQDWQQIMTMHLSNSVTDEVGYLFVARQLKSVPQSLEDTEDIEVKKLPIKEAFAMVMNGEITDSLSVAALMHVAISQRELDLL
ncbi:ADP-ribose pyrophosphatase [Thalassocella blandensis]|nr:ADP-ribose pyrophosphatase [Thalassocella blandensis]